MKGSPPMASEQRMTIEAGRLERSSRRSTDCEGDMSEWIDVNKELPKMTHRWLDRPHGPEYGHSADVLIFNGAIMVGNLCFENGEVDGWAEAGGSIAKNITHWMPLPDPPKEPANGK